MSKHTLSAGDHTRTNSLAEVKAIMGIAVANGLRIYAREEPLEDYIAYCDPDGVKTIYWTRGSYLNSYSGHDVSLDGELLSSAEFIARILGISKPEPPIKVGEYTASFNEEEGTVKVGCQTITFEEVKAVYKKMKSLRG